MKVSHRPPSFFHVCIVIPSLEMNLNHPRQHICHSHQPFGGTSTTLFVEIAEFPEAFVVSVSLLRSFVLRGGRARFRFASSVARDGDLYHQKLVAADLGWFVRAAQSSQSRRPREEKEPRPYRD